jgi:hypothetical protein
MSRKSKYQLAFKLKGQQAEAFDMENVIDNVWTPAEVAQICINNREDKALDMTMIYERKTCM